MIKGFDIKKITIEDNDKTGVPEALALVEFQLEDRRPDFEKLKVALEKWKNQLQGQQQL